MLYPETRESNRDIILSLEKSVLQIPWKRASAALGTAQGSVENMPVNDTCNFWYSGCSRATLDPKVLQKSTRTALAHVLPKVFILSPSGLCKFFTALLFPGHLCKPQASHILEDSQKSKPTHQRNTKQLENDQRVCILKQKKAKAFPSSRAVRPREYTAIFYKAFKSSGQGRKLVKNGGLRSIYRR